MSINFKIHLPPLVKGRYSKGRFFRLRNRNGSHFQDVNLFLEQVLLLPWQRLIHFKVREMCVNKAIISYIFVLFVASEEVDELNSLLFEIFLLFTASEEKIN